MKIVKLLTFIVTIAFHANIYAQYNVVSCNKKPALLEIVQIDSTESSTLIFIKFTNKGEGWINIGDKTHLKDEKTNKIYHMINSINLPLSDEGEPKAHMLDRIDQVHFFCLEFEKIPKSLEKFNLIENEAESTSFNFYDIIIHRDDTVDFINIDDFVSSTPVKEHGMSVKDGNIVLYYKHKGISVAMTLTKDNTYGSYYQAWFNIQNFTGKNLLLSPSRITAKSILTSSDETKYLQVISYEEYMKKVRKKQNAQRFGVAFLNGLAASNAGYSYSTTNASARSVTNTYGHASGRVGATSGYVSSRTTSYSTAYGRSTTRTYNAAAAYAAQQKANEQTTEYTNKQYEIKNRLSEGYLKENTLSNQTEYSGYINIQFMKTNNLTIEIPINGETYVFHRNW